MIEALPKLALQIADALDAAQGCSEKPRRAMLSDELHKGDPLFLRTCGLEFLGFFWNNLQISIRLNEAISVKK
jgi:hypothetical protein